jgi:ABC-type multidrug transport system fused ATPase/permease subunit
MTTFLKRLGTVSSSILSVFRSPDPRSLRRNALAIILFLSVPKVVWDMFRFSRAKNNKRGISDTEKEEKEKQKKDDPRVVLSLSIQKTVIELRKVWDNCVLPYCEGAPMSEAFFHSFLKEAEQFSTDLVEKIGPTTPLIADDPTDEEKELLRELDQLEEDMSHETQAGDPEKEDGEGEAEDSFLEQWLQTLSETIITPLRKACNSKALNASEEREIRRYAGGTLCLTRLVEQAVFCQRLKNAFFKFSKSKRRQESHQESAGPDAIPGEVLLDAMNRDRQKLEELLNIEMEESEYYQDQDQDWVELEEIYALHECYWSVSPKDLEKVLREKVEGCTATYSELPEQLWRQLSVDVPPAHKTLWSNPDHNEMRKEGEELYADPENFRKKETYARMTEQLAELRIFTLASEHILENAKKRRFIKLVSFVSNELCGEWKQRTLILLSWAIGAIKESASTALGYYQANLLLQSVTLASSTVLTGGNDSVNAKLFGLTDVIVGIITLNFSTVFLGDLLEKVGNAGQGSIKKALEKKLTHHVLSQDLEDCERSDKNLPSRHRDPVGILENVKRNWDYTVGRMLLIPQSLFSQIAGFVSSGLILWKQSPRLLVVVILSIFAEKRVTKWLYRIETKCTKLAGFDKLEWDGWNKNHDLSEALRKFEDMRINAKEIEIEQSVRKAQDKEEMEKACNDFFRSFFQPLNSLASIIPTIIAAYVGGRLVQQNQVSSADFGTFTYGAAQLLSKFNQLKRTTVCLYKMTDERFKTGFDIMDLLIKKPKIGIDGGWKPSQEEVEKVRKKQRELAKLASEQDGRQNASQTSTSLLGSEIEFKNVHFKYKGMQKYMLKDASFKIEAGSFVGICGERGAGKSTMFKLIMRLYDIQKGEILVGGKPIKYYNPVWLRSQIGLSKQNPLVFRHRTLRENILYGSESIVEDFGPIEADRFVESVLKKANIHHHFQQRDKFPQGLSTYCYSLSGGEKRSVGTARSLIGAPSILLLDEPTEGLDAINERKVITNIVDNRPTGQTVLVIAHRLSTIKDADYIVFVDKSGRVAERGTWDDLLKIKNGKFKSFRDAQRLEGDHDMEHRSERSDSSGDLSEHTERSLAPLAFGKPAIEAINAVKNLQYSSAIPLDLVGPLVGICDQILNHNRTFEKAPMASPRRPFLTKIGVDSSLTKLSSPARRSQQPPTNWAKPYPLVRGKSLPDSLGTGGESNLQNGTIARLQKGKRETTSKLIRLQSADI